MVDFIPGKIREFDFGIDFSKCALCKFYDKAGSRDFATIHCAVDFPMSGAFESGFSHKTAISQGDRKANSVTGKAVPQTWGGRRCNSSRGETTHHAANRHKAGRARS